MRYLSTHCKGRTADFFQACKGAVRTQTELSRFLLPYAVMDALVSTPQEHGSVVGEICLVLRGGDEEVTISPRDGGSGGGGGEDDEKSVRSANSVSKATASAEPLVGADSGAQERGSTMAIQTVFQLMDILAQWSSRGDSASCSAFSHDEVLAMQKVAAKVLEDVPKALLTDAALHIKAHARALRYFETHVRELHRSSKAIAGSSSAQTTTATTSSASTTSAGGGASAMGAGGGVKEDREASILRRFGHHNDGSANALPTLTPDQLDKLLVIYATLDDSDAVVGVETLRQMLGHPASVQSRIVEREQMEDWFGALREYSMISSPLSLLQHNSSAPGGRMGVPDGDEQRSGSKRPRGPAHDLVVPDGGAQNGPSNNKKAAANDRENTPGSRSSSPSLPGKTSPVVNVVRPFKRPISLTRAPSPPQRSMQQRSPGQSYSPGTTSIFVPLSITPTSVVRMVTPTRRTRRRSDESAAPKQIGTHHLELEAGRLRCLIEIGHLESVVDQVRRVANASALGHTTIVTFQHHVFSLWILFCFFLFFLVTDRIRRLG